MNYAKHNRDGAEVKGLPGKDCPVSYFSFNTVFKRSVTGLCWTRYC